MAEWILDVTDADIDAALEDTKGLPSELSAVSAKYIRSLDLVLLEINDDSRLTIPREQMQGLENGTLEQLSHIEIFVGDDICWPDLDVDHYLPHLLEGRYATEKWKQTRKNQAVAA